MRFGMLSAATLLMLLGIDLAGVWGGQQASEELAQFALAGLKDGRSKLQSGVFRAHGKLDRSTEAVDPVAGPIDIFSAFDYGRSLVRFDRTEPMWVAHGPSSTKKLQPYGGKFVSTPDMAIRLMSGDHAGEITASAPPANKIIRVFDVRMVGVSTWGTLDTRLTLDEMISLYRRWYLLVFAAVDKNEVYTLRWTDKDSETRTELRLDGARDFVPIRFELRSRDERASREEWGPVVNLSTVSWSRVNDVWVPHEWHEEETTGATKKRDLTFDWKSINGPIDKALFTPEGLGVDDVIFHDRRFGKPVVISVRPEASAVNDISPAGRGYRKLLVIAAVNVVLVTVFLGRWLWRRRIQRGAKEVGLVPRDS